MFFTRADGIPGAEGFLLKVEEKSSFMCSKQKKKTLSIDKLDTKGLIVSL